MVDDRYSRLGFRVRCFRVVKRLRRIVCLRLLRIGSELVICRVGR